MFKVVFRTGLLVILLFGACLAQAWAQQPLKGKWTFTVETANNGMQSFTYVFKDNLLGKLKSPGGNLPFVYREAQTGNAFSISMEVPAAFDPQVGAVSIIIRGEKLDDNDIKGSSIIITQMPDPSSSFAFVTIIATNSIKGKRN